MEHGMRAALERAWTVAFGEVYSAFGIETPAALSVLRALRDDNRFAAATLYDVTRGCAELDLPLADHMPRLATPAFRR